VYPVAFLICRSILATVSLGCIEMLFCGKLYGFSLNSSVNNRSGIRFMDSPDKLIKQHQLIRPIKSGLAHSLSLIAACQALFS